MNKLPASTTRMSENPYQPSQVEQGITGQSIGLRRILAISASYRAALMRWGFTGFRWHHLLLLILPFAMMAAIWIVLESWVFHNDFSMLSPMIAVLVPCFIFFFLSS